MHTPETQPSEEEQIKSKQIWDSLSPRQRKKYVPKEYRFSHLIQLVLTNKKHR